MKKVKKVNSLRLIFVIVRLFIVICLFFYSTKNLFESDNDLSKIKYSLYIIILLMSI